MLDQNKTIYTVTNQNTRRYVGNDLQYAKELFTKESVNPKNSRVCLWAGTILIEESKK